MNRLYKFLVLPTLFFAIVFYEVGCAYSEEIVFSQTDSYILLDRLLSLSNKPKDIKESLARYKEWENIFIKYSSSKIFSLNEMKVYLFIIFIAEQKVMIQTQEDICDEIITIFNKQPNVFLDAINEDPFLSKSASKAIASAFSLKPDAMNKESFIQKHKKLIIKKLGNPKGEAFLKTLSETH